MNKYVVECCRELRRNSTSAERQLWKEVRNRKVNGLKIQRQYPLIYDSSNSAPKFFIADFYCHEKKIVIELDGKVHDNQIEYDKNRDAVINIYGIRVVRFKNSEVEKALAFLRRL